MQTDIVIIGAGVVGLAIASELAGKSRDVIVFEKNKSFGQETSSRSSEVIHAGLYYQPGSLKAKLCINGNKLLYGFCAKHNIPHKRLGKLVIATNDSETEKIKKIFDNAVNSGVRGLMFLDTDEIKKLEPQIKASAGFISPDTGILDTHLFMKCLFSRAKEKGAMFAFLSEVAAVKKENSGYTVSVKEPSGEKSTLKSRIVVNCAGLGADKIAEMAGLDTEKLSYKIYYCKGQYFRIASPKKFKITRLVYPPPTNVSLGIHLTPDLAGGLRLGPDAKYVDKIDYVVDEGDKKIFWQSVKEFLPKLETGDMIADTSGIRPKLREEGGFRDFIIKEEKERGLAGFINLIGIESPGLTASLAIAELVRDLAINRLMQGEPDGRIF